MSQHVQRVQQDNSIFYVLLCGLLLVLVVYYLDRPRTAYVETCLLYTSPSPRDRTRSRMPSSA